MNATYRPVRVVGLHPVRIVKPRGSAKSNETRLPRETLDALGTDIESVNDDIADFEDAVADANSQGNGGETPTDDWTPLGCLTAC